MCTSDRGMGSNDSEGAKLPEPLSNFIGAALGVAGATMTVASYGHNEIDLLTVGVTLLIGSAVALASGQVMGMLRRSHQPAADAYELGHQVGYDAGYLEGRRVGRPTVVPLRCTCQESHVPAQAPVRAVAGDRLPS